MKPFLIALVLSLAGMFALSWYRGWIHLTSDRAADRSSVTVSVDKEKLHDDQAKALGAAKVATEKAAATTGKSTD
jgi:hypothetical protein